MEKTYSFVVSVPSHLKGEFDRFIQANGLEHHPAGRNEPDESGGYSTGPALPNPAGNVLCLYPPKSAARIRLEVLREARRLRKEAQLVRG